AEAGNRRRNRSREERSAQQEQPEEGTERPTRADAPSLERARTVEPSAPDPCRAVVARFHPCCPDYDTAVSTSRRFRGVTIVVVAVLVVGCSSVNPPPSPTSTPTSALPRSTASPSATATVAPTFPLAVVTGLTNLKSVIELDELATL